VKMMINPKLDRRKGPLASRRECLAFLLLMATSGIVNTQPFRRGADMSSKRVGEGEVRSRHLRPESTIGDLLRHPAFTGFARLLLPWDDRLYDEQMKLSAIGTLLPYHSHFDTAVMIDALNRLIDDAGQDRRIFYDIHTDAEKREQPAKSQTGLFFYRGKSNAPFAIIAPGGGFSYVGSVHEGFPYAAGISNAGFNAFVIKYRAGQGGAVATQDLAAAVTYVFRNADALRVSTRGYSLWGSSAGARLAASIGSHGVARFGGADLPKPSAIVMAYTAHSDLSASEPPTYVVVGDQDGISSPHAMQQRVSALRQMGTDVVYREFEGIGHGFGTGIGTVAEGWVAEAIGFWRRHQSR
jgi:acetyl esterase/lipase